MARCCIKLSQPVSSASDVSTESKSPANDDLRNIVESRDRTNEKVRPLSDVGKQACCVALVEVPLAAFIDQLKSEFLYLNSTWFLRESPNVVWKNFGFQSEIQIEIVSASAESNALEPIHVQKESSKLGNLEQLNSLTCWYIICKICEPRARNLD